MQKYRGKTSLQSDAHECIWITIQDLSLDLTELDDNTDEKAENDESNKDYTIA